MKPEPIAAARRILFPDNFPRYPCYNSYLAKHESHMLTNLPTNASLPRGLRAVI